MPASSGAIRPAATAAGPQEIRVQGGDSLRFSPAVVSVKPGKIRITFTAGGRLPQNFTAPGLNIDSGNVPPGQSVAIDAVIPRPGKFAFYSAYHKKAGMIGKIVATR